MDSASASSGYNFYNSCYRNDVSKWGGRAYKQSDDVPREIDLNSAAANSSTITRCMISMRNGCRPVQTPTSLQRDSYVPHMPVTREAGPTYTQRCPPAAAPPDAPADPSVLRPSTEYGSRYKRPIPQPFVAQATIDRCETAKVSTRSASGRGYQPCWDSSYRRQFCEKVADPMYSEAVTFHSTTQLR